MIAVIDLINVTKRYLTSTLVSNESMNSIESLCTGLPPVFHSIYFEIRANEEPRVDFTGMASTWNFSKYVENATVEESHDLSIVKKWLNNGRIPMLSFEFDIIDYRVQNPFFLWTIHRGYIENVSSSFDPITSIDSIQNCFKYEGFSMSDALIVEINSSFDKMPQSAHILHVLNMKARGVEGVRLIISIPIFSCLSFLEAIDWKGNVTLLQELIEVIKKFSFSISLQLSYPKEIRSTLGVEVYPNDPHNTELNKKEMSEFFRLLMERKLLVSDKVDDVVTWQGVSRVDTTIVDWKMDVVRDVMVKFVLGEQERPEIKFYLGANAVYKLF
ncbi:hypothetical protein FNW52_12915 [Flavobacterium sp. ZT3R18]|uniref:hypothetical protein n=1 Tax=Flavobacterium sp. ZT3R18 TaxID=2594429 RepID=UPI001179E139|nr:hypothetical protein [Flavobacterium sp. ZT3R18]TRX35033.1 hypothetical protein FNW52_12915 [Flavobacterium sp. ZT3R18]